MKKSPIVLMLFLVIFLLTGCSLVGETNVIIDAYCEEHPDDQGCLENSTPTGIIVSENDSCPSGYISDNNDCVLIDDTQNGNLTCDIGYIVEDGDCVVDSNATICESPYFPYDGSCVSSCGLPLDDANYYPCFRECYDDSCLYQQLSMVGENDYFDVFYIWVKASELKVISEFELHYVLKGETEVVVNQGDVNYICTPWMEGCEDLYKSIFMSLTTTSERRYEFDFWYDDTWYGEVHKMHYSVWNEDTETYDAVDLGSLLFYVEGVSSIEPID